MLFVVGYTYAFRCGCLSGFLQQQLVYFDPDTAYALFFGSANHYPAIATGQVIDHVSFFTSASSSILVWSDLSTDPIVPANND